MCIVICTLLLSRPARGAWVEMYRTSNNIFCAGSRAPQGARGLKWKNQFLKMFLHLSRPARGAWVEIPTLISTVANALSRPARGAWVEIRKSLVAKAGTLVAPRKGRVG